MHDHPWIQPWIQQFITRHGTYCSLQQALLTWASTGCFWLIDFSPARTFEEPLDNAMPNGGFRAQREMIYVSTCRPQLALAYVSPSCPGCGLRGHCLKMQNCYRAAIGDTVSAITQWIQLYEQYELDMIMIYYSYMCIIVYTYIYIYIWEAIYSIFWSTWQRQPRPCHET